VRAGVFLPTTRSLRKWSSLDVLKGNNWDLEGRDKVLLFVVLDSMILCGRKKKKEKKKIFFGNLATWQPADKQ
jgi:hypothetical protein